MREVGSLSPIHGDFGDGVLSLQRLGASFEINVLREALQVVFATVSECRLTLGRLQALRIYDGTVEVCEADDGADKEHRQPGHRDERHMLAPVNEAVPLQSASQKGRPYPDFAQQGCEHNPRIL